MRFIEEGRVEWLSGLTLDLLPDPMPPGISIRSKGSVLGLYADGVVGSFHLLDGSSVSITPKIGEANFLRMLFIAEGNQPELDGVLDDFVWYADDPEQTFVSAIARRFLYLVDAILAKGARQQRDPISRRAYSLTGKVNFVATANHIQLRHDRPIESTIKKRSFSTPENRLISHALSSLGPSLSPDFYDVWGTLLRNWNRKIPDNSFSITELEIVKRMQVARKFGGSRDEYQEAISLALTLMGHQGLTTSDTSSTLGDAQLIRTAHVYECYLRKVVQQIRSPFGDIVSGPEKIQLSLYDDGSYLINPDIIIWHAGLPVLLIDAKYKSVESGDHYQMISYLSRFNLKTGILISPSTHDSKVVQHTQENGVKVLELQISLRNLGEIPETIAQAIDSIL